MEAIQMTNDKCQMRDGKSLSLFHLLDPEVLANPYPLYRRLRSEAPVHWDPYLHAWVVTRYADVVTVLHHFSANRTPTPEQFTAMDLPELGPIAQMMTRQMLFMDAPAHTRLRGLASMAFTPALSARRGRWSSETSGGQITSRRTIPSNSIIANAAAN